MSETLAENEFTSAAADAPGARDREPALPRQNRPLSRQKPADAQSSRLERCERRIGYVFRTRNCCGRP